MKESSRPESLTPNKPFRAFVHFNRPYARDYILGAVVGLFFISIDLCMPLVVRAVVHRFETGNINYRFLFLAFGLLLIIPLFSDRKSVV